MDQLIFKTIIDKVCEDYGLSLAEEHEKVVELFEGNIPLYKLILAQNEDGTSSVIVSFHLELDSVAAIQWYLRLRALAPTLLLSPCYLRDADGLTHVGDDAVILRMYMMEQDAAALWLARDHEAEVDPDDPQPTVKMSPLRSFQSKQRALHEFKKVKKRKGEVEH